MAEPWWGTFEIPDGDTGRWRIGPLSLWAQRLSPEWRFAHEIGDDALDSSLAVQIPADPIDLTTSLEVHRYGFRSCPATVRLTPVAADRPLVVNPEQPVHLPAGEELIIYVSSPLWVRIEVGEPAVELCEVPTFRPTDTWFGPTTLTGELCYASRTSARLHLEDLPVRPHRAVSAVTIRNRARKSLPLERLKLPLPYLSLFTADGHLWTETVTFDHEAGRELASMRLGNKPPRHVDHAQKVCGPRSRPEKSVLTRAFDNMLRREM
jgi:hypothetical protein